MSNLNILFIGSYPDIMMPYKNVFYRNLIWQLADLGVNCTVIAAFSITNYIKNFGLKYRKIPYHRYDITKNGNSIDVYHPRTISFSSKKIFMFNTNLLGQFISRRIILNQVKKINKKFDAVYGHFFVGAGLAAIKIGKYLNIPSFVAYGECDYENEVINKYKKLNKKDIEGLSGIISVSKNNSNTLNNLRIFESIPQIVAPNSVDLSLFEKMNKNECRKILNLPQDKFIVGFVGSFKERKGDKRLLDAINLINNDKIVVAFAGRGENPPDGERVVFCNPLNHEDIPVFLNSLDVFCLPTLNEGCCNAIIEAAASGLPIVSSDLPFNYELLTKDNSLMINPNSVSEISKAIVELYNNDELRKILSLKIYQDVQKFRLEDRAKNILNFIKEIISEKDKNFKW